MANSHSFIFSAISADHGEIDDWAKITQFETKRHQSSILLKAMYLEDFQKKLIYKVWYIGAFLSVQFQISLVWTFASPI